MQPTRFTVDIPVGAKFSFWIDFTDEAGEPYDFVNKTGIVTIKNIDESATNKSVITCTNGAVLNPLDVNQNAILGRIVLSIDSQFTSLLEIPDNEEDKYGESAVYAILQVKLNTGEIPLILQVRPIKTI